MKRMLILALALSAHAAYAGLPLLEELAQRFFPFQNIGLKCVKNGVHYNQEGAVSLDFREDIDIVYFPRECNMRISESFYEKDRRGAFNFEKKFAVSYVDGVKTVCHEYPKPMQATILRENGSTPEFFGLWIFASDNYFQIPGETVSVDIDKSNGMIKVVSSFGATMWFDKETLEYRKYQFISKNAGKTWLVEEGTLDNYAKVGPYSFPRNISTVHYREDGGVSARYSYEIDARSILANSLKKESLKIFFKPGTLVLDRLNGKNYVITEVSDVENKEDAIMRMLDSMLEAEDKADGNSGGN